MIRGCRLLAECSLSFVGALCSVSTEAFENAVVAFHELDALEVRLLV